MTATGVGSTEPAESAGGGSAGAGAGRIGRAAADAAAIVLFVTVGLLSHGFEAAGYLRDALPLLAGWFAVAVAVDLYRRPSRGRFLACWAFGLPLGWLLRAGALGREIDGGELAFLGVTLGVGLAFLLAARLLLRALR